MVNILPEVMRELTTLTITRARSGVRATVLNERDFKNEYLTIHEEPLWFYS